MLGLNSSGQLGDGSTTNRSAPLPVIVSPAVFGVLSTGDAHACVTLSGGGASAGLDLHGQIRDYRDWAFYVQPVDVLGLDHAIGYWRPHVEAFYARTPARNTACRPSAALLPLSQLSRAYMAQLLASVFGSGQ